MSKSKKSTTEVKGETPIPKKKATKTFAINDIVEKVKSQKANSAKDSKVEKSETEVEKRKGPVGIDFTNPEEHDKTLEEARQKNAGKLNVE